MALLNSTVLRSSRGGAPLLPMPAQPQPIPLRPGSSNILMAGQNVAVHSCANGGKCGCSGAGCGAAATTRLAFNAVPSRQAQDDSVPRQPVLPSAGTNSSTPFPTPPATARTTTAGSSQQFVSELVRGRAESALSRYPAIIDILRRSNLLRGGEWTLASVRGILARASNRQLELASRASRSTSFRRRDQPINNGICNCSEDELIQVIVAVLLKTDGDPNVQQLIKDWSNCKTSYVCQSAADALTSHLWGLVGSLCLPEELKYEKKPPTINGVPFVCAPGVAELNTMAQNWALESAGDTCKKENKCDGGQAGISTYIFSNVVDKFGNPTGKVVAKANTTNYQCAPIKLGVDEGPCGMPGNCSCADKSQMGTNVVCYKGTCFDMGPCGIEFVLATAMDAYVASGKSPLEAESQLWEVVITWNNGKAGESGAQCGMTAVRSYITGKCGELKDLGYNGFSSVSVKPVGIPPCTKKA